MDGRYPYRYTRTMKAKLFPFRLFKEDQARRRTLEKQFRKQMGRAVSFAEILRHLMIQEITARSR